MIANVLTSVKKVLGIEEEYKQFDEDVLIHINSAFFTLKQLGYTVPLIEESTDWYELKLTPEEQAMLKTWLCLKVRLVFDPPATSFAIEAIKEQVKELEWRINLEREVQISWIQTPLPTME